ncbi:hypothetical protein mRhiFer1_008674 [Rhinolophus ferrumequinum]|uniref:Uncharacterized protein n=1 Tax=Rhinolophus ferrumequinum TaxID=59479 RepID=A0A7J7U186_RHIFE|nr:hypothetical protein mRhiFer1_008674 [Rhinolophus ferrumequinum]
MVQSHASDFLLYLPLQKRLRHLTPNLYPSDPLVNKARITTSSLTHKTALPETALLGIQQLRLKLSPGDPLFFSLSSDLFSFPSPINLIRVSPLLFSSRATTFEELPKCSHHLLCNQSNCLEHKESTRCFQCLPIALKIRVQFL